jgi:hypothetical protein
VTSNDEIIKRMTRALKAGGDTHTLEDLLDEIKAGKKQSFVKGNTWAITQVLDFPRKRVLELFMVVGEAKDLPELQTEIVEYGKHIGADFVRTQGRLGWKKLAKELGWKPVMTLYIKEVFP